MIIDFIEYLHGSKESAWGLAEELEKENGFTFSEEAMGNFKYAFYEVALKCQVDTDTGEVTILGIRE